MLGLSSASLCCVRAEDTDLDSPFAARVAVHI